MMNRNLFADVEIVGSDIEALVARKYFIKDEGKGKVTVFTPESVDQSMTLDEILKETPTQNWATTTMEELSEAIHKIFKDIGNITTTKEYQAALEKYIDMLIESGQADQSKRFAAEKEAAEDEKLRQSICDECGFSTADGDNDVDEEEDM